MGVEVEAGGCPARVTPTPPRGRGNGGCTGGRGGGVPGLAVLCAEWVVRPGGALGLCFARARPLHP